MDEKSNLKDELVSEFTKEPEPLDMTPLESIKSLVRQALGYDDLTPMDLTKHISVALRSSTGSNAIAEREAGSDILRFFAAGEYPAASLKVSTVPVQTGSGDPSPENIRPITGRTAVKVYQAAEYDEEAEPVIEVVIGDDAGTVYGGVLDVITGVLTVTMASVDLGSLTWNAEAPSIGKFRSNYTGTMPVFNDRLPAYTTKFICSAYKSAGIQTYSYSEDGAIYYSNGSVSNPGGNFIRVVDSSKINMSAADFTAAVTGEQLVYELYEPITYQLDPEELSTLVGENNIWADCGPVESITY